MSLNNAIKYRQEMNDTYKKMLETTSSDDGKAAIQKQIDFNNSEIDQLKTQQTKIFGKKEPLKAVTTVISQNPEGGITKTVFNAPPVEKPAPTAVKATQPTSSTTRLTNKSRGLFKSKVTSATENSLKAQIAAAKAAKKEHNSNV